MKLGVLVSGRGTNLQAIIDACRSGYLSCEVSVVVSNRPGVPALRRAQAVGIPTYYIDPRKHGKWPEAKAAFEREVVDVLESYGVDLVVLAGYDRLVGPVILRAFPNKVINIHPALLPAFPGLNAQKQALDYGVKVAGATVFFVDESVDGGPIIVQEAVPVLESDTVETLSERILEVEHKILPRAIRLIQDNRVRIEGRRVYIIE